MGETNWSIGDYAKHKGSLVRITSLRNPTSYEHVTYYDKGVGICCGGACMMGGDHLADMEPVTEARDLLIMKGYASQLAVKAAKELLAREQHTVEICTAALKALDEAIGRSIATPEPEGGEDHG